mmetsp:Transcript_1821/g.4137  ORF Transcript_1821/g.4137 Transcript_1821/m.4137 type:complete len:124 (-) Transcript_1821:277-648(-)
MRIRMVLMLKVLYGTNIPSLQRASGEGLGYHTSTSTQSTKTGMKMVNIGQKKGYSPSLFDLVQCQFELVQCLLWPAVVSGSIICSGATGTRTVRCCPPKELWGCQTTQGLGATVGLCWRQWKN